MWRHDWLTSQPNELGTCVARVDAVMLAAKRLRIFLHVMQLTLHGLPNNGRAMARLIFATCSTRSVILDGNKTFSFMTLDVKSSDSYAIKGIGRFGS